MTPTHRNITVLLVLIVSCFATSSLATAQEDVYRLSYSEIFGKLRRPAIDFAHEDHVVALEEQGCGACHHAPDPNTGQLVYVEDEEVSCIECHGAKEEDKTPALREAFHISCTGCHRQMGKTSKDFKGPTTCGECHTPVQSP